MLSKRSEEDEEDSDEGLSSWSHVWSQGDGSSFMQVFQQEDRTTAGEPVVNFWEEARNGSYFHVQEDQI